jgi:hypothetical protein
MKKLIVKMGFIVVLVLLLTVPLSSVAGTGVVPMGEGVAGPVAKDAFIRSCKDSFRITNPDVSPDKVELLCSCIAEEAAKSGVTGLEMGREAVNLKTDPFYQSTDERFKEAGSICLIRYKEPSE